ncbi:extradiol ring-cleavage dioxygenase [Desertibaculum subflavum]|uniref:extradiol ring-cleavage dioxygenase n=1 Tax=Desertibaculum subflavum TaxID=2268458 RepID=UPI000E66F082
MAEILALGLTHYPPLCLDDANMAGILGWTLDDPAIPAAAKDPANWPAAMRAEWGADRGATAAAAHRAALVSGFEQLRAALDAFAPDAVVIFGDDQYENFKEDVIPAFTVCAYGDLEVRPWAQVKDSGAIGGKPNVWREGPDFGFTLKGRPDIARQLATGMIEAGIDAAYAYQPLHHPGIAHAFLNAVLFLDYHRQGFPYPVICVPLNCYGRRVISTRGFLSRFDAPVDPDPPSPSPKRFMEMGAAAARALSASPWRIAMIASSSWSHAFLCDWTWRLRPDTDADRRLYDALSRSDFALWRATTLQQVETAGQHEVLNWFALMGAVEAIGAPLAWSRFVETHVFNSNKVFAQWEPA